MLLDTIKHDEMNINLPKISIVTPSYNQGQFLEETILSVISQDYPNIEYIVIDGSSSDNSVSIIKKYEHHISYWVSENDRGQSHAINKGLKRATGEIVNWLNSDDLLAPAALKIVAKAFIKNQESDFYYGDYSIIDNVGRELFTRKNAPYFKLSLLYGRQLSCQPAVFFKYALLDRIGYLDENLSFCVDLEFWTRAVKKGSKFYQIKKTIAKARLHNNSKTARQQQVLHEEHKAIVRKYNKWEFKEGGAKEDLYYIFLNKLWRTISAINRLISRGDRTFLNVSISLKRINTESLL